MLHNKKKAISSFETASFFIKIIKKYYFVSKAYNESFKDTRFLRNSFK